MASAMHRAMDWKYVKVLGMDITNVAGTSALLSTGLLNQGLKSLSLWCKPKSKSQQ